MKTSSHSYVFLRSAKGKQTDSQVREHGSATCSKHMAKIGIEKYICRYGGFVHYAIAKKRPFLEHKISQNTYQSFMMIFLQNLKYK